jgi:hypothetical protein
MVYSHCPPGSVCVPVEDEAIKVTATTVSGEKATLNVGVSGWVRLGDLEPGTIFETQDGIVAIKTVYFYTDSSICQCILIGSGEYAHFYVGNNTLVRPVSAVLNDKANVLIKRGSDCLVINSFKEIHVNPSTWKPEGEPMQMKFEEVETIKQSCFTCLHTNKTPLSETCFKCCMSKNHPNWQPKQ